MSKPKTRFCPACTSTNFHPMKKGFKCYTCRHRFDSPKTNSKLSGNGSGIIAPLTFRQQMVRDILAANALASGNVDEKRKGLYFGRSK